MFKKSHPKSTTDELPTGVPGSHPASISPKQDPTPIGPSIHISGDIRGNEDLVVYGHIEGKISIGKGLLMVTKEGQVDADVSARVITVEGQAEGDLRATEQINVRRSARVRGSISAPRISLDFGCAFSGAIDTIEAEKPASTSKNDNIADFKAAISGDRHAKSAADKASPR